MDKGYPSCDVCRGAAFSRYRRMSPAGRELIRCGACGVVAAMSPREGRPVGEAPPIPAAPRDPRIDGRRAAEVMRLIEGGRVLEMGCGSGHFLSALDPVRFKTTGLPGAPGSAALPPGAEESFDVVALFGGLGSVASPRATMMEGCRLLKPGGLAVVETPCITSLTARFCGSRWQPLSDPASLWFFSGPTLERLATTCGLTPCSSRGPFLSGWPPPGNLFFVARKTSETVRLGSLAEVTASAVRARPIGATH